MQLPALRLAFLAAFALICGEASALTLGEARSVSRLGERLTAEIDFSAPPDERLEAGCVRLDPTQSDSTALNQVSISVRQGASSALVVRSASFIREPLLRFTLHVGCGFAVQRDYSLRILPPQAAEEPVVSLPTSTRNESSGVNVRSSLRQKPIATQSEPVSRPERLQTAKSLGKERKVPPAILGDRLVLSAPVEVGEPALRLATVFEPQRGGDAEVEAKRNLLRLEFRMLQALHEQASAQLDAAEKLRQMEESLDELHKRGAELSRRLEQKTEAATLSPVATTLPTVEKPVVVEKPASEQREWPFYAGLLAIATLIGGWLFWRYQQQRTRAQIERLPVPEPYIDPQRDSEIDELDAPTEIAVIPAEAAVAEPMPVLTTMVPDNPVPATTLDEHYEVNPVMELADIMLSFGRIKGAAQALQEFIDHNPEEALQPWIRLMDVYRMAGMRSEFERVAAELNQHFNVEIQRWDSSGVVDKLPPEADVPVEPDEPLPIEWPTTARQNRSIEDLEHIADRVVSLWPDAACLDYLNQLLRDNRGGQRSGFSLPIVEEMMFLVELLGTLTKMDEEAAGK